MVDIETRRMRWRFTGMAKTQAFKKFKDEQFWLQSGACYYCKLPFFELYDVVVKGRELRRHRHIEVDHIISLSKGGTNDYSNLVLSCQPCNLAKEKPGNVYGK